MRSPGYWLSSIQSPVWIIEGTEGNIDSLKAMAGHSTNSKARFIEVKGADHFDVLAPTNELIAKKILQDVPGGRAISLTEAEVNHNFKP